LCGSTPLLPSKFISIVPELVPESHEIV